MLSAREALARLREGNERFAAGTGGEQLAGAAARRRELVEGQAPFAIVLGCSDSRVPVEFVFDCGPGDLFVIRVAGNVVAPSLIGSVEYAAATCGTRLVVVLGHSDCGAVGATVDELRRAGGIRSPNLRSITDRIRPAVEELVALDAGEHRDTLVSRAVRANVRASADRLRRGSEILEGLIEADGLVVAGAEYSLESGLVDFFDGEVEPD
jgi:carbonic anhydrase